MTLQNKVYGREAASSDPRSPLPRGLDDRFHVVEVALQRPPSRGGQPVFGLRHPPLEILLTGDVAGLLELAGMDAQVAVGRLEQLLEVVEAQVVVDRQRADDPQPHSLVDEAVEVEG